VTACWLTSRTDGTSRTKHPANSGAEHKTSMLANSRKLGRPRERGSGHSISARAEDLSTAHNDRTGERRKHPQGTAVTTQSSPEAISPPGSIAGPPATRARAGGPLRLDGDTLITIADVRRIFRLGRTAAYELTRRPDFPSPVQVSARCYRWWASEVDAFAAALPREHAQQPRPASRPRLPDPATLPRQISGRVRTARTTKKKAP
jgi:predicted DNA-binding transcriptional regulator AlpA